MFQPRSARTGDNIWYWCVWPRYRGNGWLVGLRGESRFPLQAKPPLSKGGLEGLSIWSRTFPRNAQKKDSFMLSFVRWAENETRAHDARGNSRELYLHPQPLEGVSGVTSGEGCFNAKRKKTAKRCLLHFERKTRVCPSAPHSVYQAITFAQYYTPNSRDTWVVSRCRFRVRLLPYKLQNYSCLRQIYE